MAIYLTDPPHRNDCLCCRHWRQKIEKVLEELLASQREGLEMEPTVSSEYHEAQADGFPNGND